MGEAQCGGKFQGRVARLWAMPQRARCLRVSSGLAPRCRPTSDLPLNAGGARRSFSVRGRVNTWRRESSRGPSPRRREGTRRPRESVRHSCASRGDAFDVGRPARRDDGVHRRRGPPGRRTPGRGSGRRRHRLRGTGGGRCFKVALPPAPPAPRSSGPSRASSVAAPSSTGPSRASRRSGAVAHARPSRSSARHISTTAPSRAARRAPAPSPLGRALASAGPRVVGPRAGPRGARRAAPTTAQQGNPHHHMT